jgi:mannose-6-phosphate isomerase-like protein (cupin superfamily)
MFVIPKGVEHKPVANSECKIMIVEPKGVVNTGDSGSELTAENDVWV